LEIAGQDRNATSRGACAILRGAAV